MKTWTRRAASEILRWAIMAQQPKTDYSTIFEDVEKKKMAILNSPNAGVQDLGEGQ